MTPLVLALAKFLMSRGGGRGGGGGKPPMSDMERENKYWEDFFTKQNSLGRGDPIGEAFKATAGFKADGFQRGFDQTAEKIQGKK